MIRADAEGKMNNIAYPRMVGGDRILRKGEQLVMSSKADMDEWEVRQHRKTAIFINDDPWCLVGKQFSAKEDVRYLLDPWPDAMREIPGQIIRYDEEYVKARDAAIKKIRLESGIYPVLSLMKPLIGFLPSGVKEKIETKFGVPARDATLISIFIELLLIFASVVPALLIIAGNVSSSRGGTAHALLAMFNTVLIIIVLLLTLLIDVAIRYGSYLRADRSPLGIFEWVWAWMKPKEK